MKLFCPKTLFDLKALFPKHNPKQALKTLGSKIKNKIKKRQYKFLSIQGEHMPGFKFNIFLISSPEKLRFMHPAIEIQKHLIKVHCTF